LHPGISCFPCEAFLLRRIRLSGDRNNALSPFRVRLLSIGDKAYPFPPVNFIVPTLAVSSLRIINYAIVGSDCIHSPHSLH